MSEKRKISRTRFVYYVVLLICASVLLFLLVARDMRFFLVPSPSMIPTFQPRDYLLTLNDSTFERGDLVVLDDPLEAGSYVVKRIVGVGGDTVTITWGALFINDSYVSEPYTLEPYIEYSLPSHEVPEDHVFVLGDNRNESDDSSNWPQHSVPKDNIIGKVRLIYLPFGRQQVVRGYPVVLAPAEEPILQE